MRVMTRHPSIRALFLALAASSMPALAQSAATPQELEAWWAPPFKARPGVKELTGRLVARPRLPDEWTGLASEEAQARTGRARSLLTVFSPTLLTGVDHYVFEVPAGYTEDTLAAELLATGLYQWVRPDWLLYPNRAFDVIPNDPLFQSQWHLARIQAPGAWDISAGSESIVVAVVDTGVDFTHPDLAENMVLGYCSYWRDRHTQTATPPWNTITMDSNGHGTGVAGVIAAIGDNNYGIAGVGWNLRVMPIRATSTTAAAASYSDIAQGVLWSSANGARVVSVSFAGVEDPAINDLGLTVRSRNALLVWAMDNRGVDTDFDPVNPTPFQHPFVTVVSGSGLNDEQWCSASAGNGCSSFGNGVDIAAPADSIITTTIGGGNATREGVSFAAPMVSASLAMLWSVAPSLTPGEIEALLLASADDIGTPGEDRYFGQGRLNLRRAMRNAVICQHSAAPSPSTFNPQAFSVDDIYDFLLSPIDVTRDGLVDEKEPQAVEGFMRRNEFKDLIADRP